MKIFYLNDLSCGTMLVCRRFSRDFRRSYSRAFMNCVFRDQHIMGPKHRLDAVAANSYRGSAKWTVAGRTPQADSGAGMAISTGTSSQFHKGRSFSYR
jgi:hypothetical protein